MNNSTLSRESSTANGKRKTGLLLEMQHVGLQPDSATRIQQRGFSSADSATLISATWISAT